MKEIEMNGLTLKMYRVALENKMSDFIQKEIEGFETETGFPISSVKFTKHEITTLGDRFRKFTYTASCKIEFD